MKKTRMRIFAALLAAVFAVLFFPALSSQASENYAFIRVLISIKSTKITINIAGTYTLPGDTTPLKKGNYTITASGSDLTISGQGVSKNFDSGKLTLFRDAQQPDASNYLTIYNTDRGTLNYLGDMTFYASSGKATVVNRISIEKYLYGVVSEEMSNSWPLEALKAQAVCARGYAIADISPNSTYDIGDTASDQAYSGYNASYANVIKAVDDTQGLVLYHNNKLCVTYFAASNGGQTELVGNTWGGGAAKNAAYPYLQQRDDPYDLRNLSSPTQIFFVPKTIEGSAQDCVTLPQGNAVRVVYCREYISIRATASDSGDVIGQAPLGTVYRTTGKSGSYYKIIFGPDSKTGYVTDSYLQPFTNNHNYLYASPVLDELQIKAKAVLAKQGISVGAGDIKLISCNTLVSDVKRYPTTASRVCVEASANITVKYLTGETLSEPVTLDVKLTLMEQKDGSYTLSHDYFSSSYRMRQVVALEDGTGFNVTNGRYGHGIGMSQRGAQQMANEGIGFEDILTFYYAPAELVDLRPQTVLPSSVLQTTKYSFFGMNVVGIPIGTQIEAIASDITLPSGSTSTLHYFDKNGKTKTTGLALTGDFILVRDPDGNDMYAFRLVQFGDVDGDGALTITDLLLLQKHLLRSINLASPYVVSADISRNGFVEINDLLYLQKHLLNTTLIVQ